MNYVKINNNNNFMMITTYFIAETESLLPYLTRA